YLQEKGKEQIVRLGDSSVVDEPDDYRIEDENPSCACARGILFCERTDVPSPHIDTKKTGNAPAKSDPPAEFPCQAEERASESGGPVRKAPRETFGTDRGPRPNIQHAF
ncbi:hypothetical protein, partial [Alistipes ihumii]|uniref:hypothetical protein n=1 Tax=Alistipes ihumii TaxID=1470347 RepID=UPI003AF471D8